MLPFASGKGRRPTSGSVQSEMDAATAVHHDKLPLSNDQALRPRSRGSVSSSSNITRVLHGEARVRRAKEACKQDLFSSGYFAKLNAADPSATRHGEADSSQAGTPAERRQVEMEAEPEPAATLPPPDLNDAVWKECKNNLYTFKATLDSTFNPSHKTSFVFSNDLHIAIKAFSDGKKTINKASKRVDYHWYCEHQRDKLRPMLDAQILLGHSLRRAWDEMVERREQILDKMMEEQVELGSEEMDMLLDGMEEGWFETELRGGDLRMSNYHGTGAPEESDVRLNE